MGRNLKETLVALLLTMLALACGQAEDEWTCPASLPMPANPPELIAAYKICPPPFVPDGPSFFLGEFGSQWGAFLYSDGTLVYRNPEQVPPRFLTTTIDTKAWCDVLADVDPAGFQEEASFNGSIGLYDAADMASTFVSFRNEGTVSTAWLYGEIWYEDARKPHWFSLAPNALGLAFGLHNLETTTGTPYVAEQMALWAQPGNEELYVACGAESLEWPFADLSLAPFAVGSFFFEGPPAITLDAQTTKAVRAWWTANVPGDDNQGFCVSQDGALFRVFLLDLPPGGYDAVPMTSCRTTVI